MSLKSLGQVEQSADT